jgi:hypothetical protein
MPVIARVIRYAVIPHPAIRVEGRTRSGAIQFAGVNYLAPIDIKLTDEADLRRMMRLERYCQ